MKRLLLAGLVLALHGHVRAAGDADPTGLELLQRCYTIEQLGQRDAPAADVQLMRDYGYCLGYLVGYVSGFAARDAAGETGRFCPPVDARIADFGAAVREWLVHNPDGLEAMGALVALRALQWKFPCPDQVRQGKAQ